MPIELKYINHGQDRLVESVVFTLDDEIWYPEGFVDAINKFIDVTGHDFKIELVKEYRSEYKTPEEWRAEEEPEVEELYES